MKKDGLIQKFLSFSVGSWISLLIGLVSTPVITRILVPEEFGKASFFILIMNILLLICLFGADQSFVRFYYDEKEQSRKFLLFNCLKVPLATFFVVSIFLLVFYRPISYYLFEENSLHIILLLIITVFLQIIHRFSLLVIRMQQKGLLYSTLQVLIKVFEFGFILLFAFLIGPSFEIIIYAQVFYSIIVTVFAILSSIQFWNFFGDSKTVTHSIKDILKFGRPLVLTSLIIWLFQSIDRIALKEWSTYTEVGLYSAAFKIVAVLNVIQASFTTFWVPVSYERYNKNPDDTAFFSKMNELITFLMFLVALGTLLFKDMIIYLLGSEYRSAAVIMPFLVFMPIMYTISETTVIGINFVKKTRWHTLIASTACLVNVIGTFLLVPSYGAKGAAISTGIAYVTFMIMRTHISLKFYKVNYHLGKFYTMTTLLSAYALYGTLVKWSIYDTLIGITIFSFFIILYKELLKEHLSKLLKQRVTSK
ncbi:hypothetical protein BLX87_24195 [Bacillus sp. VT-16-64]|nr:hypothetical protein BLX87_24195 [Bacillus sp. VT-16-64]